MQSIGLQIGPLALCYRLGRRRFGAKRNMQLENRPSTIDNKANQEFFAAFGPRKVACFVVETRKGEVKGKYTQTRKHKAKRMVA